MSRLTIAISTALLLLTALPAQNRREGRRRRNVEPPKLEHFTFQEVTFESKQARAGEAGYYLYLPKGHADEANKERTYPLILWLPGFGGPRDFQGRGGAEMLDKMRSEDKLPECGLVVFRAPGGRRGRTTYMNGEAGGDIEDLIVGDLLEHLQAKHRLGSKREQRAVMGVSAGGFGALKIAMRHPDKFVAVAVHSAAVLPADPEDLAGVAESMVGRFLRGGLADHLGDPIDKAKWAALMPMAIVANKKPAELKGLQVYFDAGTDDHYGFFEPNQNLDKAMSKHGHKHLFRAVDEGGHAWSSPKMKANLAMSLQFVGLALTGKDAATEMSKTKDKKQAAGK